MDSEDMNSIFEQIKNIRKPNAKLTKENQENEKDDLKDVLSGVTEEIQRVLKEIILRKKIYAELQICHNRILAKYKTVK